MNFVIHANLSTTPESLSLACGQSALGAVCISQHRFIQFEPPSGKAKCRDCEVVIISELRRRGTEEIERIKLKEHAQREVFAKRARDLAEIEQVELLEARRREILEDEYRAWRLREELEQKLRKENEWELRQEMERERREEEERLRREEEEWLNREKA